MVVMSNKLILKRNNELVFTGLGRDITETSVSKLPTFRPLLGIFQGFFTSPLDGPERLLTVFYTRF